MTILGAALFGTLLFGLIIFAVILFGAAGNKWEKDIREVTENQRARGIVGDVTMNDQEDEHHHPGRPHVHAHA
ncbi:hypothetical protein SAMN05443572_101716 [Myxococcus fulvus]|uniref:Uncharacterized protein n=1 Tax=Myxococcus fulvus TaxID=33 RepID=A0A511SV12_MYXFU|nr:hypothetical protein [Myxococcus fulvus]GEN05736.1 hypothetical protein MFU01_07730 [Myxococcus fulvus]SES96905.1 hypothetical protein SAMN05443572_101716 [Myxococcus fulvus]